MQRSAFRMPVERTLGASSGRPRSKRRTSRRCFTPGREVLEDRTLLSTVEVDLINFAFSPTNVTINVGDTIHWVWKTNFHSTTSVDGSGVSWDSGVHNSGFTFDLTFNQAGTF